MDPTVPAGRRFRIRGLPAVVSILLVLLAALPASSGGLPGPAAAPDAPEDPVPLPSPRIT